MMSITAPKLHSMHLHGGAAVKVLKTAVAQRGIDDEDFRLGIVRLSARREVLYFNRAAEEVMGSAIWLGMDIGELPLDEDSRNRLSQAMNQRFVDERGSSYRLRFRRPDLDTWVRVLISAVPEYNAAGECVGSIGYMLDETLDSAILDIHKVIADARECRALLTGVAEHLQQVLGFDSLMVVGISDERKHLVQVFEHPPGRAFVSPTKWWPMPNFVKSMIDGCETGPLDLLEMFATPAFQKYAADEPDAKAFEDEGFKSCLRLGVYREEQLVAMLSLLRKSDVAYTSEDHKRLQKLPLNEAVLAAMNFAQRDEMKFSAEFVKDIAQVANNSDAVAQLLVDQLAGHYLWSHVSLFRLDEHQRIFRLVCEAKGNQKKLPRDYRQPVSVGFLGEAHDTGKSINVGDVRQPEWAGRYHPLLDSTRSEMVLQVPGTQGRWLLNVESDLREAFANAEQKSVEIQLEIAGFTLERTASLELKDAIFNSVADAVIRTNDLFVVVEANPAAEKLLGCKPGELVNTRLCDLVHFDPAPENGSHEPGDTCSNDLATAALTRIVEQDEPAKVKFRRVDGELKSVLLSAAPLPERFGGKIFVAGDLTEQERNQRMEVLQDVFHQLASEIRVPLALGEAFLEEAVSEPKSDAHDLMDKTLRQIRKADMPLERMVRIAVRDQKNPLPCTSFDLRKAMKEMVDELPVHDGREIEFHAQETRVPVQAARHELLFCVRSLLAYLIRRKAQVEAIDLCVESTGNKAIVGLALGPKDGAVSHDPSEPEVTAAARQSDMELTLSEPVIRNLMTRMGGEYVASECGRRYFQLRVNAG